MDISQLLKTNQTINYNSFNGVSKIYPLKFLFSAKEEIKKFGLSSIVGEYCLLHNCLFYLISLHNGNNNNKREKDGWKSICFYTSKKVNEEKFYNLIQNLIR